MKNLKNENAITLIALVVTIIVLLILAGTVISMLAGDNGILSQVTKARTETDQKSIEEQIELAVTSTIMSTEHKIDETKLNNELTKYFGKEGYTLEGDNKSGWTIEVGKVIYSVDSNGVKIGPWRYAEITDEDGNTRTVVKKGKLVLEIGEEINYDPTEGVDNVNNYSYGDYSLSQYKEKNPNLKWGILGVERGNLLISTIDNINEQKFSLSGKNGYQNGVKQLNAIGAVYGHGKGAERGRSITVEDINKVTGYNLNNVGQRNMNQTGTENPYQSGYINQYGNKVTYKYKSDTETEYNWKKDGETIKGVYNHGFTYLNGDSWEKLTTGKSVTFECTGYEYNYTTLIDTSSDKNSACIKMLFENTYGYYRQYWLATSFVKLTENYVAYDIFRVSNGVTCASHLGHDYMTSSKGGGYGNSYFVRPVVILRSDVEVIENNGLLTIKS